MRPRRLVAVLALSALVATGIVGCGSSSPGPGAALNAYLGVWSHRRWTSMAALVRRPPPDFVATNRGAWSALGVGSAHFVAGPVAVHGSSASAPLTTRLTLAGFGPLALRSTVRLVKVAGRWQVAWSPRTIADQLGPGDSFSVQHAWPARAAVLGAAGASLTPAATLVTVGLVGQRLTDAASARATLVAAGFDPSAVDAAVTRAQKFPTQFSPVATIPDSRYAQIKPQIYPIPGTAFQTSQQQSPLSPDLSAHVVGHVGPVTAEQLRSLGPPYSASSVVGQNGIEQVYEKRLAGTPATTITVVDRSGRKVATLASKAGAPAQPVQTTLDPTVQAAAEAALDGVPQQAAIVVLQASTGDVLASVSRPTNQAFDLALDGALPPGSTFKVVTTTALLGSGVAPQTAATCPPSLTVDGKAFTNYEHETVANLDVEQAFAMSCNTAFIGLALAHLNGPALAAAARTYRIGTAPELGLSAYGGAMPVPATPVDLAAAAIGQDKITVSPLDMAVVAAAVDSGAVHPPRLVAGAPDDTAPSTPLDPAIDAQLKTLMTQVVTNPLGTAAGAGLPPGTAGKTGTAEFGPGPNPAEHAWFIGFRGDLAFAVFVYGGGVGGSVAAPIAAKLLNSLGSAPS